MFAPYLFVSAPNIEFCRLSLKDLERKNPIALKNERK